MFNKGVFLILFFVIAAILYYSWLPGPNFKTETYLPQWFLNWSNKNYNVHTSIPFIAVGFLLEDLAKQMTTTENDVKSLSFFQNSAISIIIVGIAEGGQVFIQSRNPDVCDVFYGILGSVIGVILYHLVTMLSGYKRVRNEK